MAKYISHSENETKKIAAEIASEYLSKGKSIFALSGDLGAGKTVFVQGFAQSLGITEKIISPTFVLIRIHKIPGTGGAFGTKKMLYHIDLYRLENINYLGLQEILNDDNNVVLIEWAEKGKEVLPSDVLWINIEKKSEEERIILTSPA